MAAGRAGLESNDMNAELRLLLARLAREHGTPCFVYLMDAVRAKIATLRRAFGPHLGINFAMKCNPNPSLLQRLRDEVEGLDISSIGEIRSALKVGWPAERISFTGPGKRREDLREAIAHRLGAIVVESVQEASLLEELARGQHERPRILVRISPQRLPRGFGVNMSGKPTQFGIDEEDLDEALRAIRALPHLRLCGFHIFAGTQCLKPDAIVENYENFAAIFRRVAGTHDVQPEKLVFGSGLGIPYHQGDVSLDLDAIGPRVHSLLSDLKHEPCFSRAIFLLETGRFLVGEAGYYLTRVVQTKMSRGRHICVCDGGMNHHLGACGHLGMVLHKPYRMFQIESNHSPTADTPFDLYGPLCSSIDSLGRGVVFPGLGVDDLLAIGSSGAYGPSASPLHFISHEPPKEILVETRDGRLIAEIHRYELTSHVFTVTEG
jgi:diaminopimelate decarboxylase